MLPRSKQLVKTADSASLWNYTLSPGWSDEEAERLRLATIKYGVGNWADVMKSGCLPGKTRTRLNLQMQRMIGQQSLGEFMGLRMDQAKVGEENFKKEGVSRKNGYIINTGNNPTVDERRLKIEENRRKYEVTREMSDAIVLAAPAPVGHHDQELRELRDRLRLLEDELARKTGVPTSAAVVAPSATEPTNKTTTTAAAAADRGVTAVFLKPMAPRKPKVQKTLRIQQPDASALPGAQSVITLADFEDYNGEYGDDIDFEEHKKIRRSSEFLDDDWIAPVKPKKATARKR